MLLLAVGGCSSGIRALADLGVAADLSVGSDMAGSCTLRFGGDVSLTLPCRDFLCHPPAPDNYDSLDLAGPIDNPSAAHAIFEVGGSFALRSYTGAELKTLDVGVVVNGTRYGSVASGTSLTISGMTRPSAEPCDGVAHGSAQASLVELDLTDGGVNAVGPGRATLNATF